jgi:hypothetical protein
MGVDADQGMHQRTANFLARKSQIATNVFLSANSITGQVVGERVSVSQGESGYSCLKRLIL